MAAGLRRLADARGRLAPTNDSVVPARWNAKLGRRRPSTSTNPRSASRPSTSVASSSRRTGRERWSRRLLGHNGDRVSGGASLHARPSRSRCPPDLRLAPLARTAALLARLRRHGDWLSPFSETALGQLVRSWFDAPAVTSLTLAIPENPADKLAELARRHCRARLQQAALMLVEAHCASRPDAHGADVQRAARGRVATSAASQAGPGDCHPCRQQSPPAAQPRQGAQR